MATFNPLDIAQKYTQHGCKNVSALKLVFVELFKGTGSMSKIASIMGNFKEGNIITVDIDDTCDATYTCDIRNCKDLEKCLDSFMKQGYIIIMHASPPCQHFSKAKTIGTRNIDEAMSLVEAAVNLMEKYSVLWVIENPSSGKHSLWMQPYSLETFKYKHDFDYCAYGSLCQKRTCFAASLQELQFNARKCPGKLDRSCLSTYLRPHSGCYGHIEWDKYKKDIRMSIPEQLCLSVLSVLIEHADIIAKKVNNILDCNDGPPNTRTTLSSNTPTQDIPSTSTQNIPEAKGKRRKFDISKEIKETDVLIYASNDNYLRHSSLNISSASLDQYTYYAMAVSIKTMDEIVFNNIEYYIVTGYRYIGIYTNMRRSLDITTIAVEVDKKLDLIELTKENPDQLGFTKTRIDNIEHQLCTFV